MDRCMCSASRLSVSALGAARQLTCVTMTSSLLALAVPRVNRSMFEGCRQASDCHYLCLDRINGKGLDLQVAALAMRGGAPGRGPTSKHTYQAPNVLVAHLEEGIEAVHLYSGRTLCKLHLPPPGLHADLNGDGVLDHVQACAAPHLPWMLRALTAQASLSDL